MTSPSQPQDDLNRPKPLYHRILLKLSGEFLAGGQSGGLDAEAVRRIAADIHATRDLKIHTADGAKNVEIAIVVGGGNFFRGLNGEKLGIERVTADHMGILATMINALALQSALENQGMEVRVTSALSIIALAEPYIRRRAIRHMEKGRVVILAAGTGHPFLTTDTAAALRAAELDCDALMKGTKVDGVYDCDPALFPEAKRLEKMNLHDVLKKDLQFMDHAAISLAREAKIPVVVFSLDRPQAIAEAVCGQGNFSLVDAVVKVAGMSRKGEVGEVGVTTSEGDSSVSIKGTRGKRDSSAPTKGEGDTSPTPTAGINMAGIASRTSEVGWVEVITSEGDSSVSTKGESDSSPRPSKKAENV